MAGRPLAGAARAILVAVFLVGFGGQAALARQAHDETADRVAIEQLTIEYSYRLDHGRANDLAELFTEDATFDNDNIPLHAVGRKAIADYYAKRALEKRTTRHVSTNLHIVFETPDKARSTRIITYYRADSLTPPFPATVGSIGEYDEVFERGADGKWLIAARKQNILFGGGVLPAK
jgi:ketosteroid isomerase-like protein